MVGAGKAAARMAAGVEAIVDPDCLSGAVVTAPGCAVPLRRVGVGIGSHPLPDERSVAATREVCRALASAAPDATVLALISGGASSLLAMPRPPVSLRDKIAVNQLLLASGADIGELNTVRKHLSLVKGGGLLAMAGERSVVTMILSDVIGDDPSIIGSAPTVPDPTTYADAIAVLHRHDLLQRIPDPARELLLAGARGDIPETVKPASPHAARSAAAIIGNNALACRAAAARARALGYEPSIAANLLNGDTTAAATDWARHLRTLSRRGRWCAIAGGETTVVVRGLGRGGRNQEFALIAARELAGAPLTGLSAGTDGIDGPTDAAGAFFDGTTWSRADQIGADPRQVLAENDSYVLLDRLGDLFRPGPTGTNVMDLKLAIGVGSAS